MMVTSPFMIGWATPAVWISGIPMALISWVIRDGRESFASLWKIFQDALIIPQ